VRLPHAEQRFGVARRFGEREVHLHHTRPVPVSLGLLAHQRRHGVRFVPGFFEDTLPALANDRWALVRLDGDTYEATRTALQWLYPGLSTGGFLIVDDYGAFEGCRRAVEEFRRDHDITEPLETIDYPAVRWRRVTEPDEAPSTGPPPRTGGAGRETGAVERSPVSPVPTVRELELEREAAALRRRLEEAEAELRRLRGSPLEAPAAWLRERLPHRGIRGRSR
jgi:hypothetical protein